MKDKTQKEYGGKVLTVLFRPVFLIMAFPAALIISISISFFSKPDINIFNPAIYGNALILAVLIYIILIAISFLMKPISCLMFGNGQNILSIGRGKVYLIFCIILALIFLPAFLALYPGYSAYDGPMQVSFYLGSGGIINSTQPVIHTLFMLTAMKIGNFLTGNGNTGILIYSLIQALVIILLTSEIGVLILGWGCRSIIGFAVMILTAGMPLIQLFSFTTTKDSIFSPLFMLWLVMTVDMIRNQTGRIGFKGSLLYFLTAVFMCLFRSQGLYLFVAAVVFILITHRKNILYWTGMLFAVFICITVITGPVYRAAGVIVMRQSAEKLSIPIQQIGRVLNQEKETVSPEDINELSNFMDTASISKYIPEISDPLKTTSAFYADYYRAHRKEFWDIYFRIGLQHPKTYLDAFFYMTEGYFYPGLGYRTPWSTIGEYFTVNVPGFESYSDSKFPSYERFLLDETGKSLLSNYPVLGYVSTIAFPVWLFYALFAVFFDRWLRLYKEHDSNRTDTYAAMTVYLVMNLFTAILLFGPTCTIRYVIPEYFCIPGLAVLGGLGYVRPSDRT